MDIRTEQLNALLQQQELQAKKSSSAQKGQQGEGFASALAEQTALGDAENGVQESILSPVQTSLVQQLLMTEAANVAATGKEDVMDQASGALDMWDSYTQKLRMPGTEGNLRDAYSLLEGIEAQVSSLKGGAQATLDANPELASLVNELEVLSTTEKIKFNRGDYLA